MKELGDIIKKGEYKDDNILKRKFKACIEPDHFAQIFLEAAKEKMYGVPFVVDDDNKDAINQLYYYLVGSPKFEGDLHKGIILKGPIGNGKTVIMESFVEVFNSVANKVITSIHSKDISRLLTEQPVGHYNKRPLFIDDLGKEEHEIKEYGTTVHPLEDMMNHRYNNFALTFATSNYKWENMEYSKHMIDRLKQMMNVMVMRGKSRRK